MFKIILEKELREILGTTKFALTFGVCALMILLAFYVGAENYRTSQRQYETSVAENLNQMEGLTWWANIDHRLFLPPQPLASLVSGISNDIGRTTEIRVYYSELTPRGTRFNENPIFAVFRFLDLEFIFGVVLSLFAILFGYDAINGEKERGTLRLTFSNSVPRDQYILGKLVGSLLALIVPLMIPILIGCLLLPLLGVPMDADSWLRLGMIIALGFLYIGVFLTLSVFVSALTQRSSSSLLMLLVLWIFVVLIIPRTAVLLAARTTDVPSIDQVDYEKSVFQRQLWAERNAASRKWFEEHAGLQKTNREQWAVERQAFFKEQTEEVERKMGEMHDRVNEHRENRATIRQNVALGLARISPTASFSIAASELASTSLALRKAYLTSLKDYRPIFHDFVPSFVDERVDIPGGIDPQELPVFQFRAPTTSAAIDKALPDIGLLILFNILLFLGAFVAFLRYDVR